MTRVYYAHSGNEADKSDWQTLPDHLQQVGSIAAKNARYFNAEDLADIAGRLHDLGKYTREFQARLEGGKRVDHATAGAKIAFEKWDRLGKIISYIVAGHHAGLANGIDSGEGRSTLHDRLQKAIPELDEVWGKEMALPNQLPFPSFKVAENFQGFQCAFLIRMLFSCLVDADFLDTEVFYQKLKGKKKSRGDHPSLCKLQHALDNHLEELKNKAAQNSPNSVNDLRQKVLNHSRKQALLSPGLFSLTVPTGGGKTLTSMAFSLDHAIAHSKTHQQRRIIYVIPFTSIIEQNAKVFRDVFKTLGDDIVLEHHSAFDDKKFDGREETKDKLKLAMENWDFPIVVTTAVQFFESLFADRTSKCRKLHNITGSVIILDEAQMLPLKLLRPTMAAIDELARNYKCSIVLCTATQPALLHSDDFLNGFIKVREIAPDISQLYTDLDRVTVRHIGVQTDEQLAETIGRNDQILIIVNNRRHAHALFDLIGVSEGHYHLTTLMCAMHRRKVLDEIRKRLNDGALCKVISTSLIEAGVDVDFPMVMRAETGLDSVAQAAGRCNREGRKSKEESEVLIFTSPEWKAPPELDQYAASLRYVMRNHEGDLLSPEAIKAYFKDVYWRKDQDGGLDTKRLLKTHRDHCADFTFPFQTIASEYRIIESYMQPVIIAYDKEAEKLIEGLYHAEFVGGLARKLQQYIVQIPERAFIALKTAGVVSVIQPERFGDQFWVLIGRDLYSEEAGLNWDNPYFNDANSSVM
ncbi:MAG: CRISPR-associated endonuclease Cas3'' [Gammaproteobacteria bacterium]|nr:CRISPR-associated endonuclease Cas3'' [Gammaproteobacteria bacterium]